jgi:hypothetical protein
VSLLKPGGGLAINTISETRDKRDKIDACVQEFRKGAFEIRMKDLKFISPNRIFFVRSSGADSRG